MAIDALAFDRQAPLDDEYVLAPFVWRDGHVLRALVRVVPRVREPAEKISRIHAGRSVDGTSFAVDGQPVLGPSSDAGASDRDGCEDPTVAIVDGTAYVYYSGWNQKLGVGQLMLATGSVERLEKRGIVVESQPSRQNPKEATIVQTADGTWRLFYEYASRGASRVGLAKAATIDGPWEQLPDPFVARDGAFDDCHLSPGPIVGTSEPVMFYNGADDRTRWRIGWIAFDAAYSRVVARCSQALVAPPPPRYDESDIAFAASALEDDGTIALYYHIADQYPHRALVRRRDEL